MRQQLQTIRERLKQIPFLTSILSMGWNLTFALVNGIISLVFTSYWYLTIFAFYLLLGLMKMSSLTVSGSRRRTESHMLLHNGIAMFGLSVILCGLMVLTIRERHSPMQNKVVAIISAAYTFAFVGITLFNTIKAHKQKSAVLISLRNISCASALISILTLERSMLGTFGNASDHFSLLLQEFSGGIAFLLMICLGINMLILSRRF